MISRPDVEKLLSVHAEQPLVLSLYVRVPRDPAQLRALPARADDLLAVAARSGSGNAEPSGAGQPERELARGILQADDRNWMGHTVAIFACGELGLAEAIPLPVQLPERAVVARRPHVRPLLLAIQRLPGYRVVVADRRHAWLFNIAGEDIRIAVLPDADTERSHGFGGWYGLESYGVNNRIADLSRQHYKATAALLDRAVKTDGPEPLVIGGHQDTIRQLLAVLPEESQHSFAGSFVVDPHTLTPVKVRDLAGRLIADWLEAADASLAEQVRSQPPGALAATGLDACLSAAGQHAIRLLLVPEDELAPGFSCQRCGALSISGGDRCQHGPGESLPVPDLFEELAVATLADGGQVRTLREPPGGVAALLRFEVAAP